MRQGFWSVYLVMFCAKCGKQIQGGTAFCGHCGQRLVTQPAAVPMQAMAQAAPAFPVPSAPSAKKITWVAMATALALVLATFFGLKSAGVLRFGASKPNLDAMRAEGASANQSPLKAEGSTPQDMLRAEGEKPTPMLQAEGTPAPPMVVRQDEPTVMPDDVRRWLEHLEKIEKRKNDLSMKQLSQMTVLMQKMKVLGAGGMGMLGGDGEENTGGDPEPSRNAQSAFDDLRPDWNKLIADFQGYPPPSECRPIADDYYRAISEIPGMNADLASILSTVASDPENAASALEKVMKIQNTSTNVIDKYLGSTDTRVGDICRKYETRKWFDIKTDVGGGIMGKFGM